MTAKETLNEIRHMGLEIDALQEQIVLLRQEAEGLKSMEITDMPRSGNCRDMSDLVAEVADLQRTRYDLMLQHIKKRERALFIIACMEKSEYRAVLLERYVLCKTWDDVAKKMCCDVRTVYRIHREALKAFHTAGRKISDFA